MTRNDIQKMRYEKNIPLALFAKMVGLSIMELWKIETDPEYPMSDETVEKIFSVLLFSEDSCPAEGA